MRNHPAIGFTGSYAQYVRLVNMLLAAEPGEQPHLSDLRIPTLVYLRAMDPDAMVQLFNGLLETMTEEGDMDAFVARDWNQGVIMGFINTMHPQETHAVTMAIQDYVEEHKEDPGFRQVHFGLRCKDTSCDVGPTAAAGPDYIRPGIGGFLGATEATREVALDNWLTGPLLTATAVFMIAALISRSLLVSGILMVTLLITLFAQYGLGVPDLGVELVRQPGLPRPGGPVHRHGAGDRLRHLHALALHEEMRASGNDWAIALRRTLDTTGSAVLISVVILITSFIPLMNTHLANTWSVSLYISVALVIDVIVALTLLPLMVRWLRPQYVFGGARRMW